MEQYAKVLALRMVLLAIIAACIAVAIMSEDMNVRALVAGIAIVLEIKRDALLVGLRFGAIGQTKKGRE